MPVDICHHNVEARSIEEIRARHRSEEADERLDEASDADAVEEPVDDAEPPAESRTPADD
ncbi:hypothetical protein [Halorubrum depositum]|uniref:hypothetical protein n=1 Tax=Halorubrum depositum TaxID=2583992 RepID=UPI0011A563AB|nr:hypothetical protein [Halorubrum depositum]